jgi:hypothetical protein
MKKDLSFCGDSIKMNSWFFDDGTIIGKHKTLNLIIRYAIVEGPAYGLLISLRKTIVFWSRRNEIEESYYLSKRN